MTAFLTDEKVKYCNDNSVPFLAVNRGHGFSGALGKFKGVQIDLKGLQGLKIHEKEKAATLQGGSYAHVLIKKLWDAGYVTRESLFNKPKHSL